MKWPRVPLNEILSLEYGSALRAADRDSSGNIPVAGSNGVDGYHTQALVNGPGIVVGRKGSAGKVTWFDSDFWPIDTTYYVKPNAQINLRWVYYLLQQLQLERLRTLTGVPGLNRNDAYQVMVPLPPLSEQRHIVKILDQADALRRKRAQADAKAARILPALFHQMFGDPVTNPMGWPIVRLEEIILSGPQNGLYKPSSEYGEGTPILRIDSFYNGQVTKLHGLRRLRVSDVESNRYGLRENDFVINRVNSLKFLGKSALIPKLSETVVFESNMMRMSVDESRILPRYLIEFLQTPFANSQMLRRAKDAINQSSINQQDVKGIQVPLPPLAIQRTFAERIITLRAMYAKTARTSKHLEDIFQSLLHSAFSGD